MSNRYNWLGNSADCLTEPVSGRSGVSGRIKGPFEEQRKLRE